VIYGDGEQSRDFTYIDNVVEANVLAAEGDASGVAVNVACSDRITVNELVERINEILGTDLDPVYDDPRPGDVRHSMADLDLVREELDYEPEVEFQDGLQRTIEWLKDE
jgi:nucleoside-diphosphate-sugar epimerase